LSSASWSRGSATPADASTPAESRNEQVSVDFRLYLRRRIPEVQRGAGGAGRCAGASSSRRPPRRRCLRTRTCDGRSPFWSRTVAGARDGVPAGTSIAFEGARTESRRHAAWLGRHCGTAYDIDTAFLADRLGFSGSSPTASTRPAIATCRDLSFTPVRWRWCT
jgi:hypothetical protein